MHTQALSNAALSSLPLSLPLPLPQAVGWADLAAHRSYLVQFARRRLMDPALGVHGGVPGFVGMRFATLCKTHLA